MVAMVALILLFLTRALMYLPEAALSAIVFLIGVGLIDLAGMRKIFEQRRSEFWLAVVSALTVVFIGVEQGILLAIALSLVDHTRHGYRPKNAVLVPDESDSWQPKPVATAAQAEPGLVIYRFTHSLYYANSQQFSDEVSLLASNTEPPLRWLCLDAGAVDDVDYSAVETLRSVHAKLKAKGIRLVIAHEMEELITHTHGPLRELFGSDAFYERLKDVVTLYRQKFNIPAPSRRPDQTPRS
jgi:MFS superfamily sulfate permease-like transporter